MSGRLHLRLSALEIQCQIYPPSQKVLHPPLQNIGECTGHHYYWNFCSIVMVLLMCRQNKSDKNTTFLNQARAGLRPARAWFLKIDPVRMSVCVCVCVCPPPRLLITSGVMWCDIDSRRLVKQVL